MKVTLQKSGGYAATVRRQPIVLDSAQLAPDAAVELRRLVERARAAPPSPRNDRLHDAVAVVISVEDDGQSFELHAVDVGMPAAFAELVAWIERRAGQP